MKKVKMMKLAASGKTVLVSTHDPELIEQCCDLELYIEHGRVLSFGEIEERKAKRGEKVTICVNT
ncbi:MAG: hypothetical protein K6E70_12650 [Butyrivibrio sp.]|nr:hypothetical protein [Butyrivibrio sp.]